MSGKEQERYSKIVRRLWRDERFLSLSQAPPNAQTLWLRLLTGPENTSIPGLLSVSAGALAEDLGWERSDVLERFGELFREGLAKADWKARLVWMPKALKIDPPANPNVVVGWLANWKELPECALKDEAYHAFRSSLETRGESFLKPFAERFPKPERNGLANQEQEQEQEQEFLTRASARDAGCESPVQVEGLMPQSSAAIAPPSAEPSTPATPLATTGLEPVNVKPAARTELTPPNPVGGNQPQPTADRPRGVQPNSWRQFGGMWTDIYSSAVSAELGTNWAFKDVRTEATLERLLNLHCLGPDANPDKVEGWIRRHVKLLVTFVRENDDEEPSYWSSYAPNGIIRFLNEGHHRAKQPEFVKAPAKPENPPAEELRPGTDEEIRSVLDSLKAMGHRGIQMPSSRAATEDEEPTPPEELEARRLEQLRKLEEFRKQCEGS